MLGKAHKVNNYYQTKTFFPRIIICEVIFHIKTHIFEYLCFCIGFSNLVYKCMIRQLVFYFYSTCE